MPPDRTPPLQAPSPALRHPWPALCCALATLALGACGQLPAAPAADGATPRPDPMAPAAVANPVQTPPPAPPHVLASSAPTPADVLTPLLSYAERVRMLGPAELAAEIAAQGDPGAAPLPQMQLALALVQLHQPVETARALGLLQRVLAHNGPESTELKPLARLLAARLGDQRRLEDTVERQNQQLRDSQRRIDQLNERLEAMRAIERSLIPRPPGAAGGPNGARPVHEQR